MKKTILAIAGIGCAVLAAQTFTLPTRGAEGQARTDDSYLKWRLLPAEQKYVAIDGARLRSFVDDQTAMSRRYRDKGHQFWGRISGTEGDTENATWLADKFRKAGLADVHEQPFDLPPQWLPQSWSVAASAGGKSLTLQSAQPAHSTAATPPAGLDLEAVDLGFGSESDLAGRDVKGKAVFFYSTDVMGRQANVSGGAIKRIADAGAAAIFITLMIPGNLKAQFYPVESKVPTFALGLEDGLAMRDMIGRARGKETPRVNVKLDVAMVPNLKTRTVWGTLPGTTDENIIIVAHRDGWFEGANDNASGVATLVGLAEYYAKIPRAERRRNIIFLGTSGHHDNVAMSGHWLAAPEQKAMWAKTALLINAEHTAEGTLDIMRDGSGKRPYGVIGRANTGAAKRWYVGGSPKLRQIAVGSFDQLGVATYAEPDAAAGGEIGLYYRNAPALQVIGGRYYWHTDRESSDVVPATALASITRAYAKIIDDVNRVDLKDLQPASASAR